MKKIMRLGVYACLLFLGFMASCTTNDDFAVEDSNVKTVIIEAAKLKSSVDSRTSLKYNEELSKFDFSWRAGDTLGIFPNKGGYQVAFPLVGLSDDTPATTAEFDGGGWALVTDAQYLAYYPFGYNNRKFTSVPVSFVGQKQVGEDANHMGAYDYMWASSELQENGKLKFFFEHLGSIIYFKVDAPEGVSELELTSIEIVSSDDETFVNKGYFNLNDETPSIKATETSAKLSLDVSGVTLKTGQTSILYVWTAPTDLRNKDITIKVYGKDQWYKMSKTISREYEPGVSYYITVNALELGGNIVDEQENGVYEINTVAELKWFANQVNSGTNDFNGKTVRLMNDIDLNNEAWTPIGQLTEDGKIGNTFKGTFDGNGFSIKNLSVTVEDGAAGLFGAVQNCIEIKNLKIENANIQSNHYAGALVGYLQENGNYHGSTYYTVKVTDCEVNNVTVKIAPNEVSGKYDNGDKAGGLIGYAASDIDITNCKVNNAKITGYRDLGGLVGMANSQEEYGDVTISNCDVRNSVITQDLTNGYKNPHPATLGAIYGRGSTDGVNNNHINVTIVCPSASATVDGVMYATLAEAISAVPASTESIITLLNDAELTEALTIPTDKNIVLDLNGNTISQSQTQTTGYSMIVNKGTLKIKSTQKDGKISYEDKTVLTAYVNYVSNTIQNSGILTIEDGVTITNESDDSVADYGYTHVIDNSGKLTINGGIFENNSDYSSIRIWCTTDDDTEVTINGGTFKGSIDLHNVNTNANKGSLNISGGNFVADTYTKCAVRLLGFGTDVDEINGVITGGTFNGNIKLNNYISGEFNSQVFDITGGTFSNPSACSYLGENANVNINMTESYEGVGFSTKAGQTVNMTLADDVEYDVTGLVGSSGTASQAFHFAQGSTVTIEGGKLTSSVARMFIQNYANLTLEGVEIAPEIPDELTSNYYYVLSNNCGIVNLNNGTKIIAQEAENLNVFAMDVCKYSTYPSVTVNVNSGASIQGNVEYSGKLDTNDGTDTNQKLNVNSGAIINGDLVIATGSENAASKGIVVASDANISGSGWNVETSSIETFSVKNW